MIKGAVRILKDALEYNLVPETVAAGIVDPASVSGAAPTPPAAKAAAPVNEGIPSPA